MAGRVDGKVGIVTGAATGRNGISRLRIPYQAKDGQLTTLIGDPVGAIGG